MTNPGRGVIPDTTPCFGTATATACTTGQPPGRGSARSPPCRSAWPKAGDGIHWVRPELGLVEFQGSKKNNIILSGQVSNTFVPFKDTNPSAKPGERYKALAALSDPRGLYAFASPDGVRWRKMSDAPVITRGKFDSQNVAFWDGARRRYRAYYREMRGPNDEIRPQGPQLGLDPKGPARDVMTCTSEDFLQWSEPRWLQYPGAPREQLYLNQIRPYYRAPHLLVGFPGRFMAGREIEKGLPITEHPSYRYGSISETLFMSSRDGISFKRWGEAFIRPGPRRERWIYPASFPAYGLLVTPADTADRPDELSLYVNDGGYWTANGKASRLRRYTLRIDGFVSARAGPERRGTGDPPAGLSGKGADHELRHLGGRQSAGGNSGCWRPGGAGFQPGGIAGDLWGSDRRPGGLEGRCGSRLTGGETHPPAGRAEGCRPLLLPLRQPLSPSPSANAAGSTHSLQIRA